MKKTPSKSAARCGRPTKDASEKLTSEVVNKARQLFISQGFSATTMEQVVAACGIGKDTLYRRFATKEALFLAVARQALERSITWFEATDAQSPKGPLERVRHLARWFLDANLDPELLALKREAFIEAMRHQPLIREDPFTPHLAEAIAAAHTAGELHAPEPSFIASQLIASIVLGPLNEALMGSTILTNPAARDAWFDKSWDLFVNGIGTGNA